MYIWHTIILIKFLFINLLTFLPMKKVFLFTAVFLLAFMTACSDDADVQDVTPSESVRSAEGSDAGIVLSDTVVTLADLKDTATVSVSGKGWWIDRVALDDTVAVTAEDDKTMMADGGEFETKCRWLTVRRSGDVIELVAEDNFGPERTFYVTVASETDTVTINGTQKDLLIGQWDDNIKLSEKEVTLSWTGDTARISTEGRGWWIDGIRLNGELYYEPTLTERETLARTGSFDAVCDWLKVSCRDYVITLIAAPNGPEVRTFDIGLSSGDYFDNITGRQEGEPLTGYWGDIIGLEPDSIAFTAAGGTAECTTENVNWAVCQIEVDGDITVSTLPEREQCYDYHVFEKTVEWLTVRANGNRLYVTAAPNTTGRERRFCVVLEAGDCFNNLYGVQSAR